MKSLSITASIIAAVLAAVLFSTSQILLDNKDLGSLADRAARLIADLDAFIGPLFDRTTATTTPTSNTRTAMSEEEENKKGGGAVEESPNTAAASDEISRATRKVFLAIEQSEGAGARVRRSVGTPQLRNLSPFLMLDHFSVKPGAGFPDHPHRGQETITYLLEGGIDHEDFAGNSGTIGPGDLQFMTAGRGIMHAEMPRQNTDGSANVGLQLWVDLPQALKSCEPRYRDLRAGEIPQATADDGKVSVKVISGQSHGIDSVKDLAYTPVWILDITMKPGAKVTQPLPTNWNAFAYTLEGEGYFGEGITRTKVEKFHNVVFEQAGQHVHIEVDHAATEDARFVLIAGMPLDQPIVQYGPFVVNSQEDIYQAVRDYKTFSNGFERGKGWQSEIGKSMMH